MSDDKSFTPAPPGIVGSRKKGGGYQGYEFHRLRAAIRCDACREKVPGGAMHGTRKGVRHCMGCVGRKLRWKTRNAKNGAFGS